MSYASFGQPCRLQRIFQRACDISRSHGRRQTPGDDVTRVIIQNRRPEIPAPANDAEVGKIRLPELLYPSGRVLALIRRCKHCKLRTRDQIMGIENTVNTGF